MDGADTEAEHSIARRIAEMVQKRLRCARQGGRASLPVR